jgi:predicted nuclease of predicted toxin-antitoxin system
LNYSKKIKIYTDESVHIAIAKGLKRLGVEAQSCQDANKSGLPDNQQLYYAYENGFVLFTHDDDFLRLDAEHIFQGKEHCGIIFTHQKDYNIGECIRRLKIIVEVLSPEEMKNHVEFL